MEQVTVKVVFPNKEIADHFRGWMSDGGGEWGLMESAEHHLGHSLSFDYHGDVGWENNDTIVVTVPDNEEDEEE